MAGFLQARVSMRSCPMSSEFLLGARASRPQWAGGPPWFKRGTPALPGIQPVAAFMPGRPGKHGGSTAGQQSAIGNLDQGR